MFISPPFRFPTLATFYMRLDPDEAYTYATDGANMSAASFLVAGSFVSVRNVTTGDDFTDSPWLRGTPSLWSDRFPPGRYELTAGPAGGAWICVVPARGAPRHPLHIPPGDFIIPAGCAAVVATGSLDAGGQRGEAYSDGNRIVPALGPWPEDMPATAHGDIVLMRRGQGVANA